MGGTVELGAPDEYGTDYLLEFQRVISTFASQGQRSILEWGMGHSTRFFLENRERLQIRALLSLEHNPPYFAEVLKTLPKWQNFHAFCLDLAGPRVDDRDTGPNYSSFPLSLKTLFDVLFIDGRRRMECALVAAQLCHQDSIVLLHDYRRERYQGVRLLFDVVEDGPQFRVMRVRPEVLAISRTLSGHGAG